MTQKTLIAQKSINGNKMKKILLLILLSSLLFTYCAYGGMINETLVPQKITFPSSDSLPVTANLYHANNQFPVIVLCHQAGFNKTEYVQIAETLFHKGYNCLAIDQRSGGHIIEWFNETMLAAVEMGKPIGYLDAEKDIIAAVDFAAKKYKKKVILWGSSYSATLALHLAVDNENVEAVIAFSPGDYFGEKMMPLEEKLLGISKPVFITSSKEEAAEITRILNTIRFNDNQIQYIPESKGAHGSRALWLTNENNMEYWNALSDFLIKLTTTY
jgi:alpha-beta hydrolase superfamily lysophospholipase